jgi:ADP-ribosylglycohydrolase
VGAIAGAIMGACHGAASFPAKAVATLKEANPDLALESLAQGLLALRRKATG